MNRRYDPVKRCLDVVLATIALILTAPVLAGAALLVWLRLGRPVLFVQERSGRGQRPFRLYKLRTMTDERRPDGTLRSDRERLDPLGLALRRLSIDELPQLINVLRGDMSLIGPRPLLPRYDPWYTDEERLRFTVRPGITGLAQVSGRNNLDWTQRLALDARYACEYSFALDVRIAWRTLVRVVAGSGVATDPTATMADLDVARAGWATNVDAARGAAR
jgi:lipopolysaccharide/colanic/teichoic acid biosynthesis glycosyltransferase